MALKVEHLKGTPPARMVEVGERLWLTADRTQIVQDGHPAARFLLAAPGQRVPASEFEGREMVEGVDVVPDAEAEEEPPSVATDGSEPDPGPEPEAGDPEAEEDAAPEEPAAADNGTESEAEPELENARKPKSDKAKRPKSDKAKRPKSDK